MAKRSKALEAQELENFQHFLFEMDDILESFLGEAEVAGFTLDYSLNSLSSLEQFMLAQPKLAEDTRLQNRAARYLGEVFWKNVGGKWDLFLEDPKNLFYRLPVINGYSDRDIEFCPIHIIGNFIGKKELGLLKRAIDAHLEFKKR
jgi:hypothetical protein